MLANLVLRAQLTAKSIARKSVFGALGGIFALVGLAFFAAAGWLWIANALGALQANLVLGGIFVLIGLLVVLYSRIPPRIIPREESQRLSDPAARGPSQGSGSRILTTASIAEAFILGLTAARSLRRRD